eukprot:scaffold136222_cov28-Tisochrysis_lutea.AAC.1
MGGRKAEFNMSCVSMLPCTRGEVLRLIQATALHLNPGNGSKVKRASKEGWPHACPLSASEAVCLGPERRTARIKRAR